MVQAGMRKGPQDYLLLSEPLVEELWDNEAVRYLKEQARARNSGQIAGI